MKFSLNHLEKISMDPENGLHAQIEKGYIMLFDRHVYSLNLLATKNNCKYIATTIQARKSVFPRRID